MGEKLYTEAQVKRLARPLIRRIPRVREFYKDPENRKAYREWYKEKYGKEPEGE